MIPVASDAQIALLPLYAEDTFAIALQGGSGQALISPAPDARLAPAWKVRGTLVAQDRVCGGFLSAQTVYYGDLLERADTAGEFMAVIRGTEDLREWALDGEIIELKPHTVAGRVAYGFWSIYASMRYRPAEGGDFPAADGIAQTVGAGRLTVTGHSLGSALATLLTFDLAVPQRLGNRATAVAFASPRVGDSSFGAAFNHLVPSARVYWWAEDEVPKLPFGFGYVPVPQSIELTPPPGLTIERSLPASHHALTYGAMLDPTVLKTFVPMTPEDRQFLACLNYVPVAA